MNFRRTEHTILPFRPGPRTDMISQELLDLLRCPLDPSHTRLEAGNNGLVCQRCRLVYPVREGIPSMLVEEAVLPAGCASIADLTYPVRPLKSITFSADVGR